MEFTHFLNGVYVQGVGRAHQFCDVYRPAFGCPMVATFNVQADGEITDAKPTKIVDLIWPGEEPKQVKFWLCQINGHYAWALRWDGTKLPPNRIEFVSRRSLPEDLKNEPLRIVVFEKWTKETIDKWAAENYQWQGFPWLPKQRADSNGVWETIKTHVDWSGASVLDVGSHYGYHSFKAAEAGAFVTAIEPDDEVRAKGELIAQHIEMLDVRFYRLVRGFLEGPDIILYLSVHHQRDPDYKKLQEEITDLAEHTRRVLFVEIILPPMFGKMHAIEVIDEMVGGEILKTYKHQVRGIRRIYKVEGKAE